MALESGVISLRRYFLRGGVKPSSDHAWIAGLGKGKFQERKLKAEEENAGWVVSGNELSSDFSEENLSAGRFLAFSLRRDVLRIPRSMLTIHVRHRVRERMRETGSRMISRENVAEIKAEVVDELQSRTPATTSIAQVLIDPLRKELYLGSTSRRAGDCFAGLFHKCFDTKPVQANFMAMAQRLMPKDEFKTVMDDPEGIFVERPQVQDADLSEGPESKLGAAFLTWLLFSSHMDTDVWDMEGVGRFSLFSDEYFLLEGAAEGSRQTLVRRGTASRCPELMRALQVGKLVSRMKLLLAGIGDRDEERLWGAVVDKRCADLSAMKAPRPTEAEFNARRLERFTLLQQPFAFLDGLFLSYLNLRYSHQWKKTRDAVSGWIGSG